MEDLDAVKVQEGATRPLGTEHDAKRARKNWIEGIKDKEENVEPEAVVIGGGQSGLTAAAQLGRLGVETLIIERNERIGGESKPTAYNTDAVRYQIELNKVDLGVAADPFLLLPHSDNWRKRYDSLVLHDPVQYDHLPGMPFPKNWPTFTPKVSSSESKESPPLFSQILS